MNIPPFFLRASIACVAATAGLFAWWTWWTTYPEGIHPVADAFDVPDVVFSLDPTTPRQVSLPSGTSISIPARAFVAPDGSTPASVDLVVREFATASDLLRAGIPMQLSPGSRDHLQSAGMLEVRARSGSTELSLRPGVELGVDLVSHTRAGAEFRLWSLDDSGTWSEIGDFASLPHAARDRELARIDRELATERGARKPQRERWSFRLEPDSENAPHLQPWKQVVWEWVPQRPGEEPPAAAVRGAWTDARVQEQSDGTYAITLVFESSTYSGETVHESVTVQAIPQLTRRQLEKAQTDYAESRRAWEAHQARLREERAFYAAQGDIVYRFRMAQLGYINIDKYEDAQRMSQVDLAFDFERGTRFLDKTKLYLVNSDNATVLSFQASDWDAIPVPTGRVHLIALIDTATAALLDPSAFDREIRSRARPLPFVTHLEVTTRKLPIREALELIERAQGLSARRNTWDYSGHSVAYTLRSSSRSSIPITPSSVISAGHGFAPPAHVAGSGMHVWAAGSHKVPGPQKAAPHAQSGAPAGGYTQAPPDEQARAPASKLHADGSEQPDKEPNTHDPSSQAAAASKLHAAG
jgi:hypothetical protein